MYWELIWRCKKELSSWVRLGLPLFFCLLLSFPSLSCHFRCFSSPLRCYCVVFVLLLRRYCDETGDVVKWPRLLKEKWWNGLVWEEKKEKKEKKSGNRGNRTHDIMFFYRFSICNKIISLCFCWIFLFHWSYERFFVVFCFLFFVCHCFIVFVLLCVSDVFIRCLHQWVHATNHLVGSIGSIGWGFNWNCHVWWCWRGHFFSHFHISTLFPHLFPPFPLLFSFLLILFHSFHFSSHFISSFSLIVIRCVHITHCCVVCDQLDPWLCRLCLTSTSMMHCFDYFNIFFFPIAINSVISRSLLRVVMSIIVASCWSNWDIIRVG